MLHGREKVRIDCVFSHRDDEEVDMEDVAGSAGGGVALAGSHGKRKRTTVVSLKTRSRLCRGDDSVWNHSFQTSSAYVDKRDSYF